MRKTSSVTGTYFADQVVSPVLLLAASVVVQALHSQHCVHTENALSQYVDGVGVQGLHIIKGSLQRRA